MSKTRPLPVIALVTFMATLSIPAAKPPRALADYFPLRAGDSWTYRNTSGGSEYTLKVLSEEKQEDGSIRYLVEKLAGVQIRLWFSKPAGWVLLHLERYPEHEGLEAKYDPPKQYLRNPLVAGAKWEWSGQDQTRTQVEEKNQVIGFEKIAVPAGKFRALKVVSLVTGGATPMTKTYWYADKVGLVKSTTEAGQIKYGSELADYSFKKPAK